MVVIFHRQAVLMPQKLIKVSERNYRTVMQERVITFLRCTFLPTFCDSLTVTGVSTKFRRSPSHILTGMKRTRSEAPGGGMPLRLLFTDTSSHD